jgi:hypothetical protein
MDAETTTRGVKSRLKELGAVLKKYSEPTVASDADWEVDDDPASNV